MLQVTNVSLQLGSKKLFEEVNLKFTKGNCYGIIGANGAGKSTFLKVLSGEIEPNKGDVSLDKNERMSVLAQNQNKYDFETVLRTVMLGHKRLVEIMDEKDALYAHADFTEEDGIRASELESEFAELGGWEAESEAETLLNELDIPKELHYAKMGELDAKQKVRQEHAHLLFRIQVPHRHVMIFRGNIKRIQKRLRFAFRFPAAELRKLAFKLGGADSVLLGEFGVRVERVFLVHDLD